MNVRPAFMRTVGAFAVFAAVPVHATVYTFAQLPISAGGLNDLAQIVGLAPTLAPYSGLPAIYQNGTVTSLGFPQNLNNNSVSPTAINNTGLVLYEESAGNSNGGTEFQIGAVLKSPIFLQEGSLNAVNNKGDVVGSSGPPFSTVPGLGLVPSPYQGVNNTTDPTGINDADQIVGHFTPEFGFGNPVVPPNYYNHDQGFLFAGGVYTTFVVPGALETDPVAINNSGEIVGTFLDATGVHGFEDENGLFSTIVGPNGGDFRPVGLNNLGQIVGSSGGLGSASYLGTPQTVPEPGSLALFGIGMAGLLGWRVRSGKPDVPDV